MNLRDQLQRIYDLHGQLTPSLVVDAARREGHPLHSHFEWNNAIAGEKYRQTQARELIRSVKVIYRSGEGESSEVRKFHSFQAPEGGHRYEPIEKVVEDEKLIALLIAQMERDWKALKKRYEHLQEFFQMIQNDPDVWPD